MRKAVVAITFISVLFICVASANAAYTAYTTLSGGASLKASYDSNRNRTPDNEKDRKELTANGSLSLIHSREGEKGGFSLGTRQTFTYNFRTENSSFSDFNLFSHGWRDLSSRLGWNFSDRFVRSNDLWGDYSSSSYTRPPDNEENAEDGPTFSDRNGSRKFWTNSFSTGLNYKYSRQGSVSIGYGNRILEYDQSDENNYKSHNLNGGTSYQFTDQWSSSLSYSYTDANYDKSEEDFTAHNAGFNLGYSHSVWNSYSAGANYNEKNYDTDSTENPRDDRNDYYTVGGNLGWTHAFSPTKTLSMSGGATHVNQGDSGRDKTSPNFNVNYTSLFENGSWFAGAARWS